MQPFLITSALFFLLGHQIADNTAVARNNMIKGSHSLNQKDLVEIRSKKIGAIADTNSPYSNIIFEKKETLASAPGTKSVVFNATGTRLYAMNLEGMSVYEFDRSARKILREFKFRPTKGTGWDYDADTAISSYEEKPVEACFSNNDKFLWVSLHNAGGIVPVMVDSFKYYSKNSDSVATKHITVFNPSNRQRDSFDVPLIKTGKTPKVIAGTPDSRTLLVSNWHSNTVSVLEIDPLQYPYGRVINTIALGAIPRGIAIDDKNYKSYITIMGGASITVVNNRDWKKENDLPVASNPRHIVMDTAGRLFVSYNKLSQVACINTQTGRTLFTANTHGQPRTIALSKNKQFLFVTCYNGNMVDVFKVGKTGFKKLYSIQCKGKPVGVDIYESDAKLEAWVCTYTNGAINVLSFKKSY